MKTAIDLFCGCGGISAGLEMAGYDILAGLDSENKYIATFAKNFDSAKSMIEDINCISPQDFGKRLKVEPEQIDLLVGGPPCQGFSKNVPRKNRTLSNRNNVLVNRFLDYALFLRPTVILMENVAEMRNGFNGHYTKEVTQRLEVAGYSVAHYVLNAADFGVPQRRRRAFFIGNNRSVEFLPPTSSHQLPNYSGGLFSNTSTQSHVTVWEAISDLPSLVHGEGMEVATCRDPESDYQRMMQNPDRTVKNHLARELRPLQYQRLSSLEPGQGHSDLPAHLRTKSGGYSGAYGRLTKEMVAPTITRWMFHPGSGRWGHPVDVRTLTIREAARIQGFPDSFEFTGSYNEQAGQLGNAVPPLLIQKLILQIEDQMRHYSTSSDHVSNSLSSGEGNETVRGLSA